MSSPTFPLDRRSSILYLHNLPASTLLGINLSSLTTNPKFHGFHAVPPGLHHFFLTPPDSEIRHSQWVLVPPSATVHLAYDPTSSHLHPCEPRAVPDGGTTAYRQRRRITGGEETSDDLEWRKLIKHVHPKTLDRIFRGEEWCCSSLSGSAGVEEQEVGVRGLGKAVGNSAVGGEKTSVVEGEEQEEIYFTAIDLKKTWREGAVGRERTEAARDRSWKLHEIVEQTGGTIELLGEWEVAFVTAVLVGSYVAAVQWRRVMEMVLTSKTAAMEKDLEDMFLDFFTVFREMCEVVKGGYVGDGSFVEVGDEVEGLLRRFGRGLRELEEESGGELIGGKRVRKEWDHMKRWAEEEMDWILDSRDIVRRGTVMTEEGDMVEVEDEGVDEEEERGEYAPVVVELPEDLMEVDGGPDIVLPDAPDPFEEGDPRF